MRAEIELRVFWGHCLSTSLSPKCATVVTFFVGFAKRLGPEMPYYLTITKSELSIDGTTSTPSAKKKNVPGKMPVVVNFVFVRKE